MVWGECRGEESELRELGSRGIACMHARVFSKNISKTFPTKTRATRKRLSFWSAERVYILLAPTIYMYTCGVWAGGAMYEREVERYKTHISNLISNKLNSPPLSHAHTLHARLIHTKTTHNRYSLARSVQGSRAEDGKPTGRQPIYHPPFPE